MNSLLQTIVQPMPPVTWNRGRCGAENCLVPGLNLLKFLTGMEKAPDDLLKVVGQQHQRLAMLAR